MLARQDPEQLLGIAIDALATGQERTAVLDEIPVPIYTADPDGAVTYWNPACVDFAGREPDLARDRWCIASRLYTTMGEELRREDCPMALAIKTQQSIRDMIAIAERPDGTRVAFKPYPTPLFGKEGELEGAINLLIDVTDEQRKALQQQAERCRRLADATYDRATSKVLGDMASSYEKTAYELIRRHR
jgi:PAS domain S-box-containing protein